MRLNIVVFILITFITGNLFSQSTSLFQLNGPNGGCVADFEADGGIIWAAATGSGTYLSTDSGNNWELQSDGLTDLNVTAITITENNIIFTATASGKVFRSEDGGNNWSETSSGIPPGVFATDMTAFDGNIFLASFGGGIHRSTNSGESWEQKNGGLPGPFATDLNQQLDLDFVIGSYPGVFKSTDGGNSWTSMGLESQFINAVGQTPDAIFAGAAGTGMYRSTDSGATWDAINQGLPGGTSVVSILTLSPDQIYITTSDFNGVGSLYVSDNGGDNWTLNSNGLNDRAINEADTISGNVLVGSNGSGVYREAGSSFVKSNNGLNATTIVGISKDSSGDNTVVLTQHGILSKIGGDTLSPQVLCNGVPMVVDLSKNSDPDGNLFAISSLPTGNSTITKVNVDDDSSCAALPVQPGGSFHQTIEVNPNTGTILVGGEGGIFRSTNGGTSWSSANSGINGTFAYDIAFDMVNDRFVAATIFGIYQSANDADSWQSIPNVSGTVVATDPTSGDIAVGGQQVVKVTDSTMKVLGDGLGPGDEATALMFDNTGKLFGGFSAFQSGPAEAIVSSKLYELIGNDSCFWQLMAELPQNNAITEMSFIARQETTENILLIGTTGAGLFSTTDPVGIIPIGTPTAPTAFYLLPNYPNPFNPSTVISMQLAAGSQVRLAVFDVLGREVRELVRGSFAAGFHQVVWDGTDNTGSQVSSGVYLYRLSSETGFVETRKMVLMR